MGCGRRGLSFLGVGEECGDDAEEREEGADVEYEVDAGAVGEPSEEGGAESTESEHESEEYAGYHASFFGHEVGGVDDDGGEGGGYD